MRRTDRSLVLTAVRAAAHCLIGGGLVRRKYDSCVNFIYRGGVSCPPQFNFHYVLSPWECSGQPPSTLPPCQFLSIGERLSIGFRSCGTSPDRGSIREGVIAPKKALAGFPDSSPVKVPLTASASPDSLYCVLASTARFGVVAAIAGPVFFQTRSGVLWIELNTKSPVSCLP